MLYVFLIASFILIINIIMLAYFCFKNPKTTTKFNKIISISIILSLALIAFLIEPQKTNDLYRHFAGIDRFREYGSFNDINAEYNDIIGAKILFYIISFLPSNHFLPLIAIIVTYGILFYIIDDFSKRNIVYTRTIAMSIFLGISICDFYSTMSGVRNTMAFAFLALSLYKDLIKKEKGIKIIWPYIIAVSIHPASWIVIALRLVLEFSKSGKLKYILLFWGIAVSYIIQILFKISPYIASKLQMYVTEEDDVTDFRFFLVKVIFIVLVYLLTILVKKSKDVNYLKYINFLQLYIFFMIGSIFVSTIMFGRLYFLPGFLLIPLLYLVEKNFTPKDKISIYIVLAIFIIGCLLYSVVQIRGNTGWVFGHL